MLSTDQPGKRADLVQSLWRGRDPFVGFPRHLYEVDMQGWGFEHPYLTDTIEDLRPQLVVELGVWKGASSIVMASKMKQLGLNGVVLAVDTWLGAWDHWIDDRWFPMLGFEFGQPSMMRKFVNNVCAVGLDDVILPLPLDSLNASRVLQMRGEKIDMLHLDGAHDYEAVLADLHAWWPLINTGGVLVGDDYYDDGNWPGVRQAFDEFFGALGLDGFEYGGGKCRIRKPVPA